jgi:hypothetical protein
MREALIVICDANLRHPKIKIKIAFDPSDFIRTLSLTMKQDSHEGMQILAFPIAISS